MAEQIRIIRGDSLVLKFACIDNDTGEDFDTTNYEAIFSTENFDKTTISHPTEVQKYTDSDGKHFILVSLKASETDPSESMIHYKLKLYQVASPTVLITGSTGDLIFIVE